MNRSQKTINGKSYRNFPATLNKLALITVKHDKQISIKGLRTKQAGISLQYEDQYKAKDLFKGSGHK